MTQTLAAAVDWQRARAYFDEWVGEHGADDGAARLAVETVLEATYDVPAADPPARRLAMSTAGSPVVYSHKCDPRASAPAFRMLAEPGGIGITVAEQIAVSRDLLGRLMDQLGWSRAAASVDAILALLIPEDPGAVADWHGGLGFGVDVGAAGPELRLYCNVRQGEPTARWERLMGVIEELSGDGAAGTVAELREIAVPRAVPAGVAVAIGDGEVRGIRLYAGLLDASADGAVAAAPKRFAGAETDITTLVDSYRSTFGDLGEQGITLAYDFAMREGVLAPSVARYKVDLFCEPASGAGSAALLDWTASMATVLGLPADELGRFASRLDRHFPGWTFQYVSLGCRDDGNELTAYCVPGQVEPQAPTPPPSAAPRPREAAPAIDRAIAYLLGQRRAPGRWEDFDTLAGPSTDWVSAHVALALAQTGRPEAVAAAHQAWARLRRRRWRSAGWGYNGKVPPDADSTVAVMRLAAALGAQPGSRAQRFLARHVTSTGAIATYANSGRIRIFTRLPGHSFAGWCGPHTCVTAAAAGVSFPSRERALDRLRASQDADGHWDAYWWDSRHYATTLAAEALDAAGADGDDVRVGRAAHWTASQPGSASPFDDALALRALLLMPETLPYADMVLQTLLRAQRTDGSWAPSARLRIPPPHVTDPEAYGNWLEGGRGGGSIQVDAGACFTTATVLQALCASERRAEPD